MTKISHQAKLIELHTKLNQAGYICPITLSAQVQVALNTKPVAGAFLFGQAGTGKSFLPETLATIMDVEYLFYQCFPGTREDDLMLKMVPAEHTPSGIALFDGVIAQAVKLTAAGKKVILALDEWDKTRPSADSFLLDFLQTGRVNFNGFSGRAQLENLYLFVTMNDERDLSEPLLRRLPKIDFRPHHPSLVREALERTHKEHPYIDSAIVLYERCLMAKLPKPATIQELRQLLDAITILNVEKKADWDMLVYQYVTKTPENHLMLKEIEDKKLEFEPVGKRKALNPEKYNLEGGQRAEIEGKGEEGTAAKLPKLSALRGAVANVKPLEKQVDLAVSCGVVPHEDDTYDACVGLAGDPDKSPSRIGNFAEVVQGNIINIKRPVPLAKIGDIDAFWGKTGEILLVDDNISMEEVLSLRSATVKVVSYAEGEIIGKGPGVEFRWTKENRLEIIADLKKQKEFIGIFKGMVAQAKFRSYASKFYFNRTWKKWTPGKTSHKVSEIPSFDAFVKERFGSAKYPSKDKQFSVCRYDEGNTSFFFYLDNTEQNVETFGLALKGKPSDKAFEYIKLWAPEMPLEHFALSKYSDKELVKDHGFVSKMGKIEKTVKGLKIESVSGVLVFSKALKKEYSKSDLDEAIDFVDEIKKEIAL